MITDQPQRELGGSERSSTPVDRLALHCENKDDAADNIGGDKIHRPDVAV